MTDLSTTKKRKHTLKPQDPRPVCYFEGSGCESEGGGHKSGDGSSSGDSIPSDAPTNAKRQKTSRILTRSSTRIPVPDVSDGEPSDYTPLPPAVLAPMLTVTAGTRANASESASTTTAIPPAVNTSRANNLPHTKSTALTIIDTESANTAPADTAPDDFAPDATEPDSPRPLPLIEAGDVPAFLRHHGKGRRAVNIFAYLNKVEDPHFRWILFHYIKFETNDKSGVGGTLPTAGRPAEVIWWTSRARPSDIPNLLNGTGFKAFTDSVLAWWGSIQPSWRTFRQGEASREVGGDWGGLYAPRINGLLNVVILAYWWASILDEDRSEDRGREDYEFFC